MAPILETAITLLALSAAAVEAKPLRSPGRHAPPTVANALSSSRRSLHSLLSRYYGTTHGLSKPPALPSKRDTSLPDGWSVFGCVAESTDERLLQGFAFSSSSLTPLLCVTECNKLGYAMAGTEYGDECYCGDDFQGSGGGLSTDSTCDTGCAGDTSESCGNAWYLSLYTYNSSSTSCSSSSSTTSSSASEVTASVTSSSLASSTASSTGAESTETESTSATVDETASTTAESTASSTTVEVALAVSATESGSASSVSSSADATVTSTESESSTATASASASASTSSSSEYEDESDSSEWYALGCAVDSSDRVLSSYSVKSSSMTIDTCLTLCEDQGYSYAGLEFGEECYCGDSISSSVTYDESKCASTCSGDSTETCGGTWALELFELASSSATTSCSDNSTTATSSLYASVSATSTVTTTGSSSSVDPTETLSASTVSESATESTFGTSTESALESSTESAIGSSTESAIGSSTESAIGSSTESAIESSSTESSSIGTSTAYASSAVSASGVSSSASSSASAYTTSSAAYTVTSSTSVSASTTATATYSTATAESTSVASASNTHQVWAHHMVGNTYPYTSSDWESDISLASAAGIDGFALNMGSDSWQSSRVADAYTAAGSSGFKLFLSLDMTSLSCSSTSDAATLVSLVTEFASESAQATHDDKVLVSTFSGASCSFDWQTDFVDALSTAGVDIFFIPSIFSEVSTFSSDTWLDGELNWNSGWPTGSDDLDTSSDEEYMSALGSKEYIPAISPFFYTHFSASSYDKNWLYRSDDWLYCTRWEQVIDMRASVNMTEILTWNDYGESSYIGPIEGALPTGSDTYVDGFTHTALSSLTLYYATAFKTGSYPSITEDEIVMWARPHAHDAIASDDDIGQPTGYDYTEDYLWAVVLATDSATVTLTSGSNTETFSVSAGLTKLKLSLSAGSISGSIARSGSTVASYDAGTDFTYTTSPTTYNFNYFVGSSSS